MLYEVITSPDSHTGAKGVVDQTPSPRLRLHNRRNVPGRQDLYRGNRVLRRQIQRTGVDSIGPADTGVGIPGGPVENRHPHEASFGHDRLATVRTPTGRRAAGALLAVYSLQGEESGDVITSYSIHYTKLYENLLKRFQKSSFDSP